MKNIIFKNGSVKVDSNTAKSMRKLPLCKKKEIMMKKKPRLSVKKYLKGLKKFEESLFGKPQSYFEVLKKLGYKRKNN